MPGQEPESGRDDGEEGGGRIDPPAQEDRAGGEGGGATVAEPSVTRLDQGQEDERGQELGLSLGRDRAEGGEDPGGEGVGEGAEVSPDGGGVPGVGRSGIRTEPESAEKAEGGEVAEGEQRGPPEALDDPDGEDLRAEGEEGTHREEVAVALVLQHPPRDLRIP